MKKVFLLLVAVMMAFGASYAQNSAVSNDISKEYPYKWKTRIYGNVGLLHQSNINVGGLNGLLIIEVDGSTFYEPIQFGLNGTTEAEIIIPGRLQNTNYKITVVVGSNYHVNTGVLQMTPSMIGTDNMTWGTVICGYSNYK